MTDKTPEYYKKRAAESRKRSADSFDRCDTDGFLSQHSNDLDARLNDAKAMLAKNKWHAMFPGLYDLKGNRVRAKLINGKYGQCWALLNDDDKFTGKFFIHIGNPPEYWAAGADDPERIKAWNRRAKNLRKKGYQVKMESAPADVRLEGSGRGLAGMAKVFILIYRLDQGYIENKLKGQK